MKSLLKNLGICLVILGAILLIVTMIIPALADLADNNVYTIVSFVLIVVGLISHIFINKRIVD